MTQTDLSINLKIKYLRLFHVDFIIKNSDSPTSRFFVFGGGFVEKK